MIDHDLFFKNPSLSDFKMLLGRLQMPSPTCRVIVTGSRAYANQGLIRSVLEVVATHESSNVSIVHGACEGADMLAAIEAEKLGLTPEAHHANWIHFGKAAGQVRNFEMLNSGADYVLAFKQNLQERLQKGGTEHMIKIALKALTPVFYCREFNTKGWRDVD